jgi:HEPN domain-containing protein
MSVTSDPPDHSADPVPSAEPSAEPAQSAAPSAAAGEVHWLHRLTAEEWLSAADNELRAAHSALLAKQHRPGVTHARRAAGMALNARLCLTPDLAYGRSYMDHLQALQKDATVSEELREAARRLLAVPTTAQLVTLGPRGDTKPADFAARIVAYAQALVANFRAAKNSDPSDER